MKLRTSSSLQTSTAGSEYYEVKDENGERYAQCGSMRDVEILLSLHPTFSYEKMYLPNIKHPTVNVSSQRLEDDKALPESQWAEIVL